MPIDFIFTVFALLALPIYALENRCNAPLIGGSDSGHWESQGVGCYLTDQDARFIGYPI
jgi:hypothetical protein